MTPPPRLSTACALLVLQAVLVGPLVGQTDRPEVHALHFEGNTVFADEALRAAIVHEATRCRSRIFVPLCWAGVEGLQRRSYLQPREFRLDMLRLQVYYIERGYREVQVDTTLVERDDGVEITFEIDEGRPVLIDSLELLLVDPIPDSSAFSGLPVREGDPLSALALDAARDTVMARLRDQGYAHADALINYFIPAGGYDAQVTLDVEAGPLARFGEIGVENNVLLDVESVRRMLPFREGSRYRRSQVLEGQRNLYSLDIVQSAVVEERRDEAPADTVIPVRVSINEGDLHRVRTGLGWTTADCLTTEARWASRNFYGGARRLEARARLSNILAPELGSSACPQAGTDAFARLNGQVSLELVQPWIFSPRNSLTAGAYVERQSLPEVFVREALGFNLALRRSIGQRANLTLSYQPQLARLEAAEVFFCASFLACLPSDIAVFQAANWLAPVGVGVARDRRNSVLNPSRGYLAVLDLEYAGDYTGSNFEYARALGEATTYVPFGTQIGAFRLRAGVVGRGRFEELGGPGALELVHPQKRFYSGGGNSVRGFAENRLGPRVLTVDVAELLGVPAVDGATQPACAPEQIDLFGCDPSPVPDGEFSPRAVGGNVVLEGNVELRFPLLSSAFQGVTFVDFGNVWSEPGDVSLGELEFTPGAGVRYFSPIGPIRIDVAYRFREGQQLPVATSGVRPFDADRDAASDRIMVRTGTGSMEAIPWVRTDQLTFLFRSDPYGADSSFLSRLQLHFSIGQAF